MPFLIFFLVLDFSACCCSLNVIVPGAGVNRDTCAKQEPGKLVPGFHRASEVRQYNVALVMLVRVNILYCDLRAPPTD